MSSFSEFRDTLKEASAIATLLIGAAFLLDGFFSYPRYGIPLVISAVSWLGIHARDQGDKRAAAAFEREEKVLKAFGTSESELRSLLGLSEDRVTALLDDPKARAELSARLEKALRLLRQPGQQSLN